MCSTGHLLYDELRRQLGPRAIPTDQWQWQKWGKFLPTLVSGPILGLTEISFDNSDFWDQFCFLDFVMADLFLGLILG